MPISLFPLINLINTERTAALADFLHTYNHHHSHTVLNGHPPISRINNAAGQYT